MTLRLHNTLTRTKEDFVPLDAKNVRVYVCGPTVYDFAHIGNARPVIVFDVLFRLLRHLYGEAHVTYVRNITDIDDKINARAAERRISIRELTDQTYKQYSDDVAALGCLSPTYEPRATDHIEEMKDIVERLVSSEHAYVADEHVLFSVPSMPEYGQLSKRPLDEMIAGARVDVAPYKRSPIDFVLWKPSDQRQTNYRIPAWPSPHKIETPGRPGWHLECSAMAWKFLKETFDIHGGGIDLVFPHHENEIAQSRCAFHTSFMAKYWMHNGFLNVEGDKMSKSLGNFVTIRELLADWPGEVLRLNMMRTHYRQPMDWTLSGLTESQGIMRSWREAMQGTGMNWQEHNREWYSKLTPSDEVLEMLEDDLNIPAAMAVLHRLAKSRDIFDSHKMYASLALLGLISFDGMQKWEEKQDILSVTDPKIQWAIERRNAARKAKDFKESDRIRDELLAQGIVLKDSPDGTTWEVKR